VLERIDEDEDLSDLEEIESAGHISNEGELQVDGQGQRAIVVLDDEIEVEDQ
jgi:hypothetical protein